MMALGITVVILLAEVAGGILSGSLALLADAGHMFSDIGALGVSLFALWIATRPAPRRNTYGYYRIEILSALFNSVLLIVLALFVFFAAWRRFQEPPPVHATTLVVVASAGLVGNLLAIYLLYPRAGQSLNIRGAMMHLMGDAASSVGVISGGVIMAVTGWYRVDALISAGIAVVILVGAWILLREVVDVLLEATPRGLDPDDVARSILGVAGVDQVHDLHIWSITSGMPALSGHVIASREAGLRQDALLNRVKRVLLERYQIEHTTLQVESPDYQELGQVH